VSAAPGGDPGPGQGGRQEVTCALEIKYHLHSAWRPQWSGKVKKINQSINRTLAKIYERPWGK
jgi:hypothetical protein